VVADDHLLNFSGSVDQHTDLPVQLMGKFTESSGHFGTNDQVTLNPSAAHPLQYPEMVFFQSLSISTDPGDDQSSLLSICWL
jgi:hypothetical protein